MDVDSASGLSNLVACAIVEDVREVEADLSVCVVLDLDVDGLGVDTGKRRRGVEVVVVGTCANLEIRWRVRASVAKCSVYSGDEVQRLELVSWQGLEFVRWEGSVDEGDCVVRVLGDLCGWRGRWKILLFSTNVLSSSAVTPSRFSRRGEGAREGQRTLR